MKKNYPAGGFLPAVLARLVYFLILALPVLQPDGLQAQHEMRIDPNGNTTIHGDFRARAIVVPVYDVDGDLDDLRRRLVEHVTLLSNNLDYSSEDRGRFLNLLIEATKVVYPGHFRSKALPVWLRIAQETGFKYDFKYAQFGEKRISFMPTDVRIDTQTFSRHYPVSDLAVPSDVRLKTGVTGIGGALDRVRRLRGVTHRWNEAGLAHLTRDAMAGVSAGPGATGEQNRIIQEDRRNQGRAVLAGTHVGVLAQEVEAVLPEAVMTVDGGFKHVRYQDLVPLLIEAMKEQDQLVQTQAAQLRDEARISDPLQRELNRLRQNQQAIELELAALRQSINQLIREEERLAGLESTGAPAVAARE